MEEILGLRPTGREIRDPAARLVEATDEQQRTYTVICFDEAHRGHAALSLNVELVLSFMEFPMVTGLVGLGRHDLTAATFAFGTGSVWTLAEVTRIYQDFGQVVGLRAGLELAWLAAQVLVEAGETGPMQGCFSHGNLSPTRIALRADGMVQVFGYGLAQVEMMRHREEGLPLEPRSLQHCPPERLEGVPEDAAADTYALTLIVYELITGKPLLDSLDVDELTRMVGMSEGATLLSRSHRGLPAKVAKVFARSLVYDPDTRLSGQAYVDALGDLLANEALDGPSLAEVVETLQGRVQEGMPKARKLVSTASTTAFTPEMLAAMADDDDDDDDDDEQTSSDSRWKKVDRRRGRRGTSDDDNDGNAADDDNEEASASSGRRRRRRAPESDASSASATRGRRTRRRGTPSETASTEQAPEGEAKPTRERRRRGNADDRDAAGATGDRPRRRTASDTASPAADEASGEEAQSRRRRRRAPAAESETTAAPAPDGDGEADEASPTRRRRRRSPAAPEADAEPAAEAGATEEASPRRRRRRAPEAPTSPEEAAAPPRRRRTRAVDDDEDEAPSRRRRVRRDDDDDDDDVPARRRRRAPSSDEGAAADEAPSRRRRRKPDEAADSDAETSPPDETVPAPRRRRRRKPTDD